MEDIIMKKIYLNPTMDVVEIMPCHQLLVGSETLALDPSKEIEDPGEFLSREDDFNFDDF